VPKDTLKIVAAPPSCSASSRVSVKPVPARSMVLMPKNTSHRALFRKSLNCGTGWNVPSASSNRQLPLSGELFGLFRLRNRLRAAARVRLSRPGRSGERHANWRRRRPRYTGKVLDRNLGL
jgi:hypothetical protein